MRPLLLAVHGVRLQRDVLAGAKLTRIRRVVDASAARRYQTENFTEFFLHYDTGPFMKKPAPAGGECVCLDVSNLTDAIITMTDGDDCAIMRGDSNQLWGHDGADMIVALGNENRVFGGAGNDTISTNGTDTISHGNAGGDSLYAAGAGGKTDGGSGFDRCYHDDAGIDHKNCEVYQGPTEPPTETPTETPTDP